MKKIMDLTGNKYGMLLVLRPDDKPTGEPDRFKRRLWVCQCDCGRVTKSRSNDLRCGVTKSCGCYKRDLNRKHGHRPHDGRSPTYSSWCSLMQRRKRAGATVCEAWCDFKGFLEDMGLRPAGAKLRRVDRKLGYSKDNCQWTASQSTLSTLP